MCQTSLFVCLHVLPFQLQQVGYRSNVNRGQTLKRKYDTPRWGALTAVFIRDMWPLMKHI